MRAVAAAMVAEGKMSQLPWSGYGVNWSASANQNPVGPKGELLAIMLAGRYIPAGGELAAVNLAAGIAGIKSNCG